MYLDENGYELLNPDYLNQDHSQDAHLDSQPTAGPVASAPGPNAKNAAGRGVPIQQFVDDYRRQFNLNLKQSDPAGWQQLVDALHTEGYTDAKLDTRSDGMHKGILTNGSNDSFVKLADGSDRPIWLPGGDAPSGGGDTAAQQQPFSYPSFDEKFSYQPFEAPTDVTEQNDPGFKARLEQGQQALERSAAARGTLLTGGTLKDLQQFGQDYASNEYGKVYDRAAQTYGTNYNKAAMEYNNRFSQHQSGFNNALASYGTNFGTDQALWSRAFNQNNQGFAQLYDIASLGLNAAGASNTASQHYTDAAGNLITGTGNANAAGQVASGNAYNNAFGQIANLAQYNSLYRNRPTPQVNM